MNRAQRRAQARQKPTRAQKSKVFFGFPHHRFPTIEWTTSWEAFKYAPHGLDVVSVDHITGSLTAAARNTLARNMLASDAEWLFMIDDDMDFDPMAVPALLAHADAQERPIVGGLCFTVDRHGTLRPTMYRMVTEPHTHLRRVEDWQDGALVQVDATGAAFMAIHRSVLEALDDGSHSPWFNDGELGGERIGEDISFCLSARQAGFPVYVASAVDVGHVKPYSFGLSDWRRQRREQEAIPTFAVIPVKESSPSQQLTSLPGVVGVTWIPNDDRPLNISSKWNAGMEWAREQATTRGVDEWNVLILNDDVILEDDTVTKLARALRMDEATWVSFPNVHGFPGQGTYVTRSEEMAGQTISGYAFMIRGERPWRFDETFAWWYQDSDLERHVRQVGGQVICVGDAFIQHLNPNVSTVTNPELLAQARRDEAAFAAKWHLDPETLFLAQNPDFGASVATVSIGESP